MHFRSTFFLNKFPEIIIANRILDDSNLLGAKKKKIPNTEIVEF